MTFEFHFVLSVLYASNLVFSLLNHLEYVFFLFEFQFRFFTYFMLNVFCFFYGHFLLTAHQLCVFKLIFVNLELCFVPHVQVGNKFDKVLYVCYYIKLYQC